jgi:tetratricopeptide (TPR) repeat protein
MINPRGSSMKKIQTYLVFTLLLFGSAAAQRDSLSCRTALNGMLRRKADMQTLNEYDPETFQKKTPRYLDEFTAFLDSLTRFGLWKYVPDPMELKIEKARLDFFSDPSFEKRNARSLLERILGELRTNPALSRHGMEFAELGNYLGTLYYQIGDVASEIKICREAVAVLQQNKKGGEAPSLLEWMIRTKLANALSASSPSEALQAIDPIQSLDVRAYRDYAINPWRKERLENTVASAWEALGSCRSASGNIRGAIGAYEKAMEYSEPGRSTWDSIVLSIVKLQAESGNVPEVTRWAATVQRRKPENLLSLYLVSGNAFHEKKYLDAASEAYRNAFALLQNASAEEQIKVLSSLVRIYADLGLQDRIFETLANLMKNRNFLGNDELSTTFSNACVTLGIQVRQNAGRYKEYFKAAEKVLCMKASGNLDFVNNRYAGKTLVLLSRLYLIRNEGDDLENAGECLDDILAGYRKAVARLGLSGDYASDDVIFAKLARAKIKEIKDDPGAAVESYQTLVSDYVYPATHGDLKHHASADGLDSSAASLFRISSIYLKSNTFAKALDICERLSRAQNLPPEMRQKAEFMAGRVNYYWGFAERIRFQQALAAFNRIGPESGWRTEADFMAAMCQWHLDFQDAAVAGLTSCFSRLREKGVSDRLVSLLTDEHLFGYARVISESVFMKGNGEKADALLSAVLDVIARNRIDTPEEAKGLYALARFTMRNGLPKEQKLKKVEALLDTFFRNRHAADDQWTFFKAGELRMDLDFELGRLTAASVRRQIQRLEGFRDSKEELRRIVDSRNFYKGPGLFSLDGPDLAGLGENVRELLAKSYYMLGRVNGREARWDDAMDAYDVVWNRYSRFDVYASRALYQKGLIYLTALNRVDKAVNLFIRLFKRYDGSQIAVQAMEDLREAERIAKTPAEISAWFKACRKMFDVSGEKPLSRFAVDLAFVLTEKHVGEDERFTHSRAVMTEVTRGLQWLALLRDTSKVGADDVARANLLLARALRLESDLSPGSVYLKFGVTYPEKGAEMENRCFRRAMTVARSPLYFREAQWRLTVNLALMGRPEESKDAAWIHRAEGYADTSVREMYEKEIGVLVAYAAPGKTRPYTRDVKVAVESIIDESAFAGLFPFLEKAFDRTRRQVEIMKRKNGRTDIRPDVLDLKNYPAGKWKGGEL